MVDGGGAGMGEIGWPEFVRALPAAVVPLPGLDARVVDNGTCQVALFDFAADGAVPVHTHLEKWGIVVAGSMELTVDGLPRSVSTGDAYFVPAGVPHGASVRAGTRVIEIFSERRFEIGKETVG